MKKSVSEALRATFIELSKEVIPQFAPRKHWRDKNSVVLERRAASGTFYQVHLTILPEKKAFILSLGWSAVDAVASDSPRKPTIDLEAWMGNLWRLAATRHTVDETIFFLSGPPLRWGPDPEQEQAYLRSLKDKPDEAALLRAVPLRMKEAMRQLADIGIPYLENVERHRLPTGR